MEIDDIDTIAVLGAGTMGHGIAEVAAIAGYDVVMRDIEEAYVQDGYEQIEWSLGKLVEQDRLDEDDVAATLDRIEPVVDLPTAVAEADVVIEAVPERFDVKADVFETVDDHAPEAAIISSNTSSISITDLAEVTDRPERFCGMHFFNPPVRMPLVEVISGDHTDDAVLETIEALATAMDKTPVRVRKDSPGFIVNRVLVPLMNEAAWLVHEGETDVATVDSTATYEMGLPMGVFELVDVVGVDVALDVLEYIRDNLGDAYEPAPPLLEMVEEDRLGQKTDHGFYDYDDGGVDIPSDAIDEDVRTRLLAVMANEVAKLLDGDVADLDDIDRAMKLGTGFPEGPSRLADDAGAADLHAHLEETFEASGHPRHEPTARLGAVAEAGGFHATDDGEAATTLETVSVHGPDDDHVAELVIDRPHRMNTISEQLLDELEAAIDRLDDDPDARAVILRGAGDRAFSAGADVQSMAGSAEPLTAVALSRLGQRVFGKLAEIGTPVVAQIDGYCLGGGMELATAADFRIASERSTFGQPEHDLGLLPGWGGTQRLPRLVGLGRAKEIIFTADHYEPDTMASYGFLNEVVPADDLESTAHAFAADLAAGPPVAQRFTKRAMHRGADDLEAGLEVEAQAFGQLFTTDDLMEGFAAFMGDRDPEFEGT